MNNNESLFNVSKQPLRIEVVRSTSKFISSMSDVSAKDIVSLLSKHYSDVIMTNVNTIADLEALVARKPDLVFSGLYFIRDEARNGAKVWLADILEQHGIPYTGSDKHANRLSLNKHLAKQRLVEQGINTPAFKLARRDDTAPVTEGSLQFPLFVKPSNKSGGQGIDVFSVVHTTEQLQDKVRSIHENDHTDALIEEYLSGREFSVAIIGDLDGGLMPMPLELVAAEDSNGDRIRSQIIKSTDSEDMNEVTDPIERALVGNFAVDAFRAIGGAGYGRIDLRFNSACVPFFLEANHIPSLLQIDSSFLRAYEFTYGKDYEAMLLQLVQLALDRNYATTRQEFSPNL